MGRRSIDITGKKYGRLLVVSFNNTKSTKKHHYYNVVCDCGNSKTVAKSSLVGGSSMSCGCLGRESASLRSLKDLTGRKFGMLTVIHRNGTKRGRAVWLCECECGGKKNVDSKSLLDGATSSCGCKRKIAEVGKKYNALTVLSFVGNDNHHRNFLVRCDCGKEFVTSGLNLTSGSRTSCGCVRRKRIGDANRRHGKTGTRAYLRWQAMINRCERESTKSYKHYGARGISVCDEWHVFENYYRDTGEPPFPDAQLDRINNDGNYCKENTRWVTRSENIRNSRCCKKGDTR